MPCFKPLDAWRSQEVNASGKRSLTFTAARGFGDRIPLPCGRCVGCRLEHSRQWAVRCMHEASRHEHNCFLTLTFRDDELARKHWTGEFDDFGQYVYGGTLTKEHWQKFMKRLRKRFNAPIQYFHCGEYGDRYGRPHHHACLFGVDFPDKRFYKNTGGGRLYTSEALDAIWGHGHCTIGEVTFESAAYVARYVMKKITGDLAQQHYEAVDFDSGEIFQLKPEFVTMSLKRPIGKEWYDTFKEEVSQDDSVVVRGREMKPPKYYDRLLERADPGALKRTKEARLAQARANSRNSTPARLAVREQVAKAKLSLRKREIE